MKVRGGSGHDDVIFCSEGGLSRDDGRWRRGEGGKKKLDFWMTSFVNDPLFDDFDF